MILHTAVPLAPSPAHDTDGMASVLKGKHLVVYLIALGAKLHKIKKASDHFFFVCNNKSLFKHDPAA